MNIVTTADKNYFHCLQLLRQSVVSFYDKPLIVYDVGLTDEQKKIFDAVIIPMDIQLDFQSHASAVKGTFIKATHKPFCVKHYFENHDEPMMLVDADCMFMEKVEESGFDVGVTLRSPERRDLSNAFSGVLNTGVIFFNVYAEKLIDRWMEACEEPNTTDQKALTDILSETIDWRHYNRIYDWYGTRVKVFSTDDYNDFYRMAVHI